MNPGLNISGDARVALPLFQQECGGSIPTSPLQLKIYKITLDRAKQLNYLWHSRLPNFGTGYLDATRINYGAFYNGICYAIAIWGMPGSPSLPYNTWLELKRLAIATDAPKYTSSYMIVKMTKFIKKLFPNVVMLISYQDTEVHTGTIYKASGWNIGRYHKGAKRIRANERGIIDNIDKTSLVPKIRWQKELHG